MVLLVYIFFGVVICAIVLVAILLLSMSFTEVYMFLYAREEWRYWKEFSRNVDKFEYVGRYAGDGKSYEFIWDDYKAIVWSGHFDGYASVHSKDGEEVLATMYWKSKSKKFADKLRCKIPTEVK